MMMMKNTKGRFPTSKFRLALPHWPTQENAGARAVTDAGARARHSTLSGRVGGSGSGPTPGCYHQENITHYHPGAAPPLPAGGSGTGHAGKINRTKVYLKLTRTIYPPYPGWAIPSTHWTLRGCSYHGDRWRGARATWSRRGWTCATTLVLALPPAPAPRRGDRGYARGSPW